MAMPPRGRPEPPPRPVLDPSSLTGPGLHSHTRPASEGSGARRASEASDARRAADGAVSLPSLTDEMVTHLAVALASKLEHREVRRDDADTEKQIASLTATAMSHRDRASREERRADRNRNIGALVGAILVGALGIIADRLARAPRIEDAIEATEHVERKATEATSSAVAVDDAQTKAIEALVESVGRMSRDAAADREWQVKAIDAVARRKPIPPHPSAGD